jgi:hypothetical protein
MAFSSTDADTLVIKGWAEEPGGRSSCKMLGSLLGIVSINKQMQKPEKLNYVVWM